MGFWGSSYHTIDSKGRIIIPTRFQVALKNSMSYSVVLAPMDGGLFAYPPLQWNEIKEKFNKLAETSEAVRRFRRLFIGNSCECLLDGQHRILIPPTLRDDAKLEKEVVLVGVGKYFEIWCEERWRDQRRIFEETDMQREEVKNEIAKLGL